MYVSFLSKSDTKSRAFVSGRCNAWGCSARYSFRPGCRPEGGL